MQAATSNGYWCWLYRNCVFCLGLWGWFRYDLESMWPGGIPLTLAPSVCFPKKRVCVQKRLKGNYLKYSTFKVLKCTRTSEDQAGSLCLLMTIHLKPDGLKRLMLLLIWWLMAVTSFADLWCSCRSCITSNLSLSVRLIFIDSIHQFKFVKDICLLIHHQTQKESILNSSCIVFLTDLLMKTSGKRMAKQINVMFGKSLAVLRFTRRCTFLKSPCWNCSILLFDARRYVSLTLVFC